MQFIKRITKREFIRHDNSTALSKLCTHFLAWNSCKQFCKQLRVQSPVATPSMSLEGKRECTWIIVVSVVKPVVNLGSVTRDAIPSFYCLVYEQRDFILETYRFYVPLGHPCWNYKIKKKVWRDEQFRRRHTSQNLIKRYARETSVTPFSF